MSAASASALDVVLTADALTAGFGTSTVLHGVDLEVRRGEVAGIFGLNGAGKSVTMKVLAGVVPARSGSVRFLGDDVTTASAEERVRRGMAHVPQGRQVFGALSVEENLRLGAFTLRRRDRASYRGVLDGVYDRFPILRERRAQLAGTLSGGQQAMLAVGRALMSAPQVILVDEPTAGLSPVAAQDLLGTLQAVAGSGVTMVLVEQNIAFGLRLATTANLLQVGRVVHSGPIGELDAQTLSERLGVGRLLTAGVGASLASSAAPAAPKRGPRKAASKKPPAKAGPRRSAPRSTDGG